MWVFVPGKILAGFKKPFTTLRPSQCDCHFPEDIFNWNFLNKNVFVLTKIPFKFVPRSPITNIHALFQIMAWCRLGYKPFSEPMMANVLMHICVTKPQWVKLLEFNLKWCGDGILNIFNPAHSRELIAQLAETLGKLSPFEQIYEMCFYWHYNRILWLWYMQLHCEILLAKIGEEITKLSRVIKWPCLKVIDGEKVNASLWAHQSYLSN